MFKDYRKYQRYSILASAKITRLDEGSQESLTAQVSTISQGGMGFYAATFLEKATPVAVEFLVDALQGIGVLEGKIASVCSQGNDYFVGIAFDREISYDRFVTIIG